MHIGTVHNLILGCIFRIHLIHLQQNSIWYTLVCFSAEDESNRFEIYSLKLNCVVSIPTSYSRYFLIYAILNSPAIVSIDKYEVNQIGQQQTRDYANLIHADQQASPFLQDKKSQFKPTKSTVAHSLSPH